VEECRNSKSNLLCFFMDFRNDFDTVPKNNLLNRLEELKVPFKLIFAVIILYETDGHCQFFTLSGMDGLYFI